MDSVASRTSEESPSDSERYSLNSSASTRSIGQRGCQRYFLRLTSRLSPHGTSLRSRQKEVLVILDLFGGIDPVRLLFWDTFRSSSVTGPDGGGFTSGEHEATTRVAKSNSLRFLGMILKDIYSITEHPLILHRLPKIYGLFCLVLCLGCRGLFGPLLRVVHVLLRGLLKGVVKLL